MADEKDYHGKQNYTMILGVIGVLLIAMVGMGLSMSGSAKVWGIGALAAVQFFVVVNNLMHLKFEPALVKLVMYVSVICVIIFIFGTAPDTLMVNLDSTANGAVWLHEMGQ